ncbi:MAG: sodium:calcium antiporter [Gammaproteobacteria bacterium]|nr:sodium:calcium antiporter [Gammaproteobacteria bacterium]
MPISHITIWLYFMACVITIGIAGTMLTRYGDAIADKTGLGGTWIGLVLLATVTSLPELAAGISAVTIGDLPNIAVGDVFGSCAYNLILLVLLDYMNRAEPLYAYARRGHVLSAGFGIILVGCAGISIMLTQFGVSLSFSHIGVYSPVILLVYGVSIRTVFSYEKAHMASFTEKETDKYPEHSLRELVIRYVIAASFVVAAGILLPHVAAEIAVQMGWTQSFVGTVFAALATSLPELVVTIAAVRIGAVDMAIGDLLGSNMFDILILAIDDIFYLKAPLFESVSSIHLSSALSAMTMTGVAIVALYYRSRYLIFNRLSWASVFLVVVYATNAWVLYSHDHPSIGQRPEISRSEAAVATQTTR